MVGANQKESIRGRNFMSLTIEGEGVGVVVVVITFIYEKKKKEETIGFCLGTKD